MGTLGHHIILAIVSQPCTSLEVKTHVSRQFYTWNHMVAGDYIYGN